VEQANGAGQGIGHGGPARGYKWPQATEGNEIALQHGAYSPRRVGELADDIATALLDSPDTASYLQNPEWAPLIASYARAQAIVTLMWRWLDSVDTETALGDVTESEESEERDGTKVRRRSTTKHVESVLTQLHRHEVRALNLATQLGLTPVSRARLPRNFGSPQVDVVKLMAEASARMAAEGSEGSDSAEEGEAEAAPYLGALAARTRGDRRRAGAQSAW
jgi:hypothetical protein